MTTNALGVEETEHRKKVPPRYTLTAYCANLSGMRACLPELCTEPGGLDRPSVLQKKAGLQALPGNLTFVYLNAETLVQVNKAGPAPIAGGSSFRHTLAYLQPG